MPRGLRWLIQVACLVALLFCGNGLFLGSSPDSDEEQQLYARASELAHRGAKVPTVARPCGRPTTTTTVSLELPRLVRAPVMKTPLARNDSGIPLRC